MSTTLDLDAKTSLPRLLAAAPHRLLFFIGAANVLLAMTWWTLWLVDARWQLVSLPQPAVFAGHLHAVVMQYQVLPPFIFGFLLTVFPRWTKQKDLGARHYLPVGIGLLGGQAMTLAGLVGPEPLLHIGAVLTILGFGAGLLALLRVALRDRGQTKHVVSMSGAMSLGLVGLLLYAVYLHRYDPLWVTLSIKLGTFGLLLPVYFTVAHRMFPFFAGNVVTGHVPWRPAWVLAAFWPLTLGHLALELSHANAWLWTVDAPLFALAGYFLWRNWPRAKAPPLLWVLFYGYAWLPIAMALYVIQSSWLMVTSSFILGRGPAHALYVGFFGSLLVAMVTRVTQGHSGRPLVLGKLPGLAFILIQVVTVTRVMAEVTHDVMAWQAIAGMGWIVAFLPWVIRSAYIYGTPRVDGKAG